MSFEGNWNLESVSVPGSLLGLAGALVLALLAGRWPDPASSARVNLRLAVIGLFLPSLVAAGNLWAWIPPAMILGGLSRAWLPSLMRLARRFRLPRAFNKYGWPLLGLALLPGIKPLLTTVVPASLTFHTSAAFAGLCLLTLLASQRWLLTWTGAAGMGLAVAAFGPLAMVFPLAYFLTHASRGDRRAAAVILLPLLVTGVSAYV